MMRVVEIAILFTAMAALAPTRGRRQRPHLPPLGIEVLSCGREGHDGVTVTEAKK